MPVYKVNGSTYNIPDEKVDAFEKRYPDSKVEIYDNDGVEYSLPVSKRAAFQKKYDKWSYAKNGQAPDVSTAGQPVADVSPTSKPIAATDNLVAENTAKASSWPLKPQADNERSAPQIDNEHTAPQAGNEPLTEQERNRMMLGAQMLNVQTDDSMQSTNDRINNIMQYGSRPMGGQTMEGEKVYNPETGKLEQTYITPTGGKTTDKQAADKVSRQYREAADMSIGGQIRKAAKRLEYYRERMEKRRLELKQKESEKELGGFLGWASGIGENMAHNRGGNINYVSPESTPAFTMDDEYQSLRLSARKAEEEINQLEEAQRVAVNGSKPVDFFRHTWDRVKDLDGWTFGGEKLKDEQEQINLDWKVRNGEELSDAETDALYESYMNENVMSQFGDLGKWAQYGDVAGSSLMFMKDFLYTKSFSGLSNKIGSKLASKMAVKAATKLGKEATESIGVEVAKEGLINTIKSGGKGVAKKLLAEQGLLGTGKILATKSLGVTAEDLLVRAPLMVGTVQLQSTAANTIDTKLGPIEEGEDGNLHFANDKTWGEAAWQAGADAVIENFSEMWGAHLPGVSDVTRAFGARGLTAAILRSTREGAGTVLSKTANFLRKAGVNGYLGEVGEEYYGQLWRTMLNLDSAYGQDENGNKINNFRSKDFNGDIWAGMALSIGLTGSGTMAANYAAKGVSAGIEKGKKAIDYVRLQNSVDIADAVANERLTPAVWAEMKPLLDASDNADIGQVVTNIMTDPSLNDKEREAVMDYVEKSLILRGNNLREYINTRDKVSEDLEDDDLNQAYFNGYKATQKEEKVDIKNMMALEGKKIEEVFGKMPSSDEIYENAVNGKDRCKKEAAIDYLTAQRVYDGMVQRVRDDINLGIAQSDAMIDKNTHMDGKIHTAKLKDDKEVYIIDGEVRPYEDGSGVDLSNSSTSIIIRHKDTGDLEQISPESILSIGETQAPFEQKSIANTAILGTAKKRADEIDGIITQYDEGDTYTVEDEDGNPVQIQVVADGNGIIDNGDGTVNMSDGKQVFPFSKELLQAAADEENMSRAAGFEAQREINNKENEDQSIYARTSKISLRDENGNTVIGEVTEAENEDGKIQVQTKTPFHGRMVNMFTREELDGMLVEPNDDSAVQPIQVDNGNAPDEVAANQEEVPVATVENPAPSIDATVEPTVEVAKPVAEEPVVPETEETKAEKQPAEEPIPTKEDGSIDFVAMGEERTRKTLHEKYGDKMPHKVEVTRSVYEKELKKAKTDLEKAQQAYDDAPIGKEQKAETALEKAQSVYDAAMKEAEFWGTLDDQLKKPTVSDEVSEEAGKEILSMTEPLDGEELAASMLAGGLLPITQESYMNETGAGKEESKGMFGLFRSKENGGMSIEVAGEQLMLADHENGTNFFDQEDANAGRNAIIEVLSVARTRRDLSSYITKRREEEARKVQEAERNAMEDWYAENVHATPEEQAGYEESMSQIHSTENDDISEIYAIFAEDTNQKTKENGKINEGTISGYSENGPKVLQGEQSGDTGGDRQSQSGGATGEVRRPLDSDDAAPSARSSSVADSATEEAAGAESGAREESGAEQLETAPVEVKNINPIVDNPSKSTNFVANKKGNEVSEPISQGSDGENQKEDGLLEQATAGLQAGRTANARVFEESGRNGDGISQREEREIDSRNAEKFAKENNLWTDLNKLDLGDPGPSGNESDTYIRDGYIYKVNNLMNTKGGMLNLMERVRLHNEVFPNTSYELTGFTGFSGSTVMPIFKQMMVKNGSPASVEDIGSYMKNLGFKQTGDFTYSNGEVEVFDLRPRNVLKDEEGDIYVIDADLQRLKPTEDAANEERATEDATQETFQEDNAQVEEIKERLGSIDAEIEKAKDEHDLIAAAELISEKDGLERELGKTADKKDVGNAAEKPVAQEEPVGNIQSESTDDTKQPVEPATVEPAAKKNDEKPSENSASEAIAIKRKIQELKSKAEKESGAYQSIEDIEYDVQESERKLDEAKKVASELKDRLGQRFQPQELKEKAESAYNNAEEQVKKQERLVEKYKSQKGAYDKYADENGLAELERQYAEKRAQAQLDAQKKAENPTELTNLEENGSKQDVEGEVNSFSIGDSKTVGNGRKIRFTKINPTATFKAVEKYLQKLSEKVSARFTEFQDEEIETLKYKVRSHLAKTGSRYIHSIIDGVDYNMRFSNHTKPDELGNGIEVGFDNGKISDIGIDLSLVNANAEDVKGIIEEVKGINETPVIDLIAKRANFPLLDKLGVVEEVLHNNNTGEKYNEEQRRKKYSEYVAKTNEASPLEYRTKKGLTVVRDGETLTVYDGDEMLTKRNRGNERSEAQQEYRDTFKPKSYKEWAQEGSNALTEEQRSAFEGVSQMLKDKGVEVVSATDEMTEEVMKQKSLSDDIVIRQYSRTLSPHPTDAAKLQEIIDNLSELSKNVENQASTYGAIIDFANAIGAKGNGVSKYAEIALTNGNVVSIRISNHNANANSYAKRDKNGGNISIVFKSAKKKNDFVANDDVELTEYVYTKEAIAKDGNILSSIAESLSDMIKTGNYVDKSGKAIVNESPSAIQAMIGYHGSPHNFDTFDHSHMGSGEGAQAHGWGTYIAKDMETGEGYAEMARSGYTNQLNRFSEFERISQERIDNLPKEIEADKRRLDSYKEELDDIARERREIIEKYGEKSVEYSNFKFEADDYEKGVKNGIKQLEYRIKEDKLALKAEQAHIEQIRKDREEFLNNLPKRQLYTVDIPENDGTNYLEEDKPLTKEQRNIIEKALKKYKVDLDDFAKRGFSLDDKGGELYGGLLNYALRDTKFAQTNAQKATSDFLSKLGFAGVRYDGRQDGECFVIFDEKDLRIKEHTQFFKSRDGKTIYGWMKDGKIYLTKEGMNPNTPLHEFTHIYDAVLQKENPRLWANGKELMKQTAVWDEVVNDPSYADIRDDEDKVASEVHSRLVGKDGAGILTRMMEEAKAENDLFAKSEKISLVERLKSWLKDAYRWLIGKDAFDSKQWSKEDLKRMTLDDFNAITLGELTKARKIDDGTSKVRDAEYQAAVERGDMETALKMLAEEAKKKGYSDNSDYQGSSAFNGAAPSRNEEYATEKEKREAIKNRDYEGDVSMADAIDNPDVFALNDEVHARMLSYHQRRGDTFHIESIKAIRAAREEYLNGNKNSTIKMYRSVPSGVKESSFRNGDWITPSKSYAKDNAEIHSGYNGEENAVSWDSKGSANIIEMDVPIKDIWWDENDINEWGYDDGKVYSYKNTENNRKEFEVTYDDNGKLIPLSERFIESNSDARFMFAGEKQSMNENTPEEQAIIEESKKNGTYMKAPNGKPTKLTAKQWAQVRTKAFKDWFGNWEKVARIEKLRKSKPINVEFNNEYELNRDSAKAWMKDNLRGVYTIEDTGEKVSITNTGVNKVTSHSMGNAAHLKSIVSIPELIRKAVFVEERPNEKGNDTFDSYRYYVLGANIDGEEYTIKLTIGVKQGKKYYDHALTQVEKGKLLDQINDQAAKTGFTTSENASLPTSAFSEYKDTKLISILQTNSSKVLDENGEPMVVYHGTLTNGLHIFDKKMIGSRYSYDDKGFFFISNKNIANDYSTSEFDSNRKGEVVGAYIGLKNPLIVDAKWCAKNGLGKNIFNDNDVIEFWDNYQSLMIDESEKNDGAVITDGKTTMAVAFEPNQIKSATENNGEFSTKDDNIRYREGESFEDGQQLPITHDGNGYSVEGVNETFAKKDSMLDAFRTKYSNYVATLSEDGSSVVVEPWNKYLGKKKKSAKEEKKQESYVERKTRNAEKAVQDLAGKLGLDVEVLTDTERLTGKRARAKGWFDKKTGKITIVLSNHSNQADVMKTLLHEGVAHYGLRKMLGDRFDVFLDNVYANSSKEIREKIASMAARNGWDFRKATEEYLAGLAEDTDFKNANQSRWWNEIKKSFIEMLEKIGITLKGALTDNDLRYILWRSYKNLEETGANSLFVEAEDIAMQNNLKVGQYEAKSENAADNESAAEEGLLYRDSDPVEHERALARDEYERRVRRKMYQSVEAIQDSMLGLKEAYKAILGKGWKQIEDVDGFENAYLGENRLSSTNKAEADAASRLLFKPLLDVVAKLAPDYESRKRLIDYMMAKHGLERNIFMAEREAHKEYDKNIAKHPNSQKTLQDFIDECRKRDYAGLTALTGKEDVAEAEAEAQKMVDNYEMEHGTTKLWNKVNAVNKAILSKLYECGMMSKETLDEISGMYKYYIPLRGFDEKTSAEEYAYLNSKHSAFNAPIKKAGGRGSKADDPLAYMQSMIESAIMQGNRNKLVKQRFLNFVLNHPSDLASVSDLWLKYDEVHDKWDPVFPDDIDSEDTPKAVEQKMRDFEDRMRLLAEQYPDRYKHGEDAVNIPYRVVDNLDNHQHQVVVKRNGRDYLITINGNPRAAQALNGLTNPDNDISGAIGAVMRLGERINRKLSAFYTTRDPDFIASNYLRDMLYSNTMVWIKENPNYALRFNRHVAEFNIVAMKLLFKKYRLGTLDMGNKTEKMFYQFMMNGGETGYSNIRDIEQHKSDINRELKKSEGTMNIERSMSLLGERFDEWNRAVENSARFSAFVTSREMGRTIDRAIYDAKEISVNFNKKGSGAKFYEKPGTTWFGNTMSLVSGFGRAGYVFWNASVQGTTNFGRQFKRHPAKAFSGLAAMYLLGAVVAGLAGGDDDDEEKGTSYYDLPEYVRRSNIIFKAGDYWISIPLPIEYRAIYGMGELMMSTMSGKERMTSGELASSIASQVSQILPIDFMEGGGGLNAFVPSSIKPIVESYFTKKGWTGLPLYKGAGNEDAYNKYMPEWTKAFKNSNKQIVGLCAALNEASGGDTYTKGTIDINPAKVENMLTGYFGGVYKTIDKMVKTAETIAGKREFDPKSLLLVNRVVKSGDERTEYRVVNNEYQRLLKEHDRIGGRMRGYENDTNNGVFDYAEKIDFLYNSPEYTRYEIFESYKKDIDALYEELKEAPDEEYRKEVESELNELKKQLVDDADKTRK